LSDRILIYRRRVQRFTAILASFLIKCCVNPCAAQSGGAIIPDCGKLDRANYKWIDPIQEGNPIPEIPELEI